MRTTSTEKIRARTQQPAPLRELVPTIGERIERAEQLAAVAAAIIQRDTGLTLDAFEANALKKHINDVTEELWWIRRAVGSVWDLLNEPAPTDDEREMIQAGDR